MICSYHLPSLFHPIFIGSISSFWEDRKPQKSWDPQVWVFRRWGVQPPWRRGWMMAKPWNLERTNVYPHIWINCTYLKMGKNNNVWIIGSLFGFPEIVLQLYWYSRYRWCRWWCCHYWYIVDLFQFNLHLMTVSSIYPEKLLEFTKIRYA